MNEEEIERKAVEELLLEAKRARERAEEHGTFGWNKPKVAAVNKRFLKNTLVSTMRGETDRGDAKRFVPKHKPLAHDWHGAKRRGSPERSTEGEEKAKDDAASKSKKPKDGDMSTEKPKVADKDHLRDYDTNGDNSSKDLDLKRESGSSAADVGESKPGDNKTVSGATHSKEKSPVRAKSNASKGHSYSESSKGRDRMTRDRH